jgi:hypothetical protein
MVHELKILPKYFNEILQDNKSFELRRDRGFKVGDTIVLNEWIEDEKRCTGLNLVKSITYILKDVPQYGLMDGFVILSI